MPVKKVSGGYQWGSGHGKFKTKAEAEAQSRAAHANGYRGDYGANANALVSEQQSTRDKMIHDMGFGGTAFVGLHRGTTSATEPVEDDGVDGVRKIRKKKGQAQS